MHKLKKFSQVVWKISIGSGNIFVNDAYGLLKLFQVKGYPFK